MTDLATRQTAPLATTPTGFGIEGLEGLGQGDIVIPRWTIVQATSRAEGAKKHVGEFHRNIDGTYAPALRLVVLQASPTRNLWSGDLNERRPECFSRDAVTGSLPRNEAGEYGACATCAFNIQFNRELMAERERGLPIKVCSYGYTFLTAEADDPETMALFTAMGTSARPAKILISQFVQRKRSPFSAIVALATREEKNDKGTYMVMHAEIERWLTPEEAQPFREQYLAMRGASVREYEETDEAAGASTPAGEPGAVAVPF